MHTSTQQGLKAHNLTEYSIIPLVNTHKRTSVATPNAMSDDGDFDAGYRDIPQPSAAFTCCYAAVVGLLFVLFACLFVCEACQDIK